MRGWRIKLTLAVVLLLAPLAFGLAPVRADSHSVIEGSVSGGTPSVQVPESLEVSLIVIDGDTVVGEFIEATGPDGRFTFSDIPTGPNLRYLVSVVFQDALYQVETSPDEEAPIDLLIYVSTSNEDILRVIDDTIMLTPGEKDFGELMVRQVIRIENDQQLTFIPSFGEDDSSDMSFLRFSLPPGYRDLTVRSDLLGGDSIPFDTGVAVTAPVPPGTHAVVLTYLAPYEDDSLVLEPFYPFGADVVRVFLREGLGTAIGSALEEQEGITVGGNRFRVYETAKVERRDTITLGFSNLPQASWISRAWNSFKSQWGLTLIIPAISASFLVALLAYAWSLRRRRLQPTEPTAVIRNIRRQPAQFELLESIARLDESLGRGEISEEDYNARRADLKRALLRSALADARYA